MSLHEFVPMSEGGELPWHRVWYFRQADIAQSQRIHPGELQGRRVIWDRRRRMDVVFESGDTAEIKTLRSQPPQRGRKGKGKAGVEGLCLEEDEEAHPHLHCTPNRSRTSL